LTQKNEAKKIKTAPASLEKLALEQLNRPNSAVSYKCPTAALLSIFGLSHVLQVRSFALNLSALHLDASKTPCYFLVKYLFDKDDF